MDAASSRAAHEVDFLREVRRPSSRSVVPSRHHLQRVLFAMPDSKTSRRTTVHRTASARSTVDTRPLKKLPVERREVMDELTRSMQSGECAQKSNPPVTCSATWI